MDVDSFIKHIYDSHQDMLVSLSHTHTHTGIHFHNIVDFSWKELWKKRKQYQNNKITSNIALRPQEGHPSTAIYSFIIGEGESIWK